MKSYVYIPQQHHGSVALAIFGLVVQLVLTVQLYSSFGGAGLTASTTAMAVNNVPKTQIPFRLLATVMQERLSEENIDSDNGKPLIVKVTNTLSKLASNQQTFKGLDGVAHEAYQRTHTGDDATDISVSGRAQRRASRLAAVAEAFYACELVEIAENPELSLHDGDLNDGILRHKELLLNVTLGDGNEESKGFRGKESDLSFTVLVIYEPLYTGGMGLEHGSLLSLFNSSISGIQKGKQVAQGRLLVVLGNKSLLGKEQRINILDETPRKIKLSSGLVTNEVASVQSKLYDKAGELLNLIEPQLRQYNSSSVHFLGHSLAGGVANLAATILDGSIPMPTKRTKRKYAKKNRGAETKQTETVHKDKAKNLSKINIPDMEPEGDNAEEIVSLEPLNGLGRARSSALTLGSPPCLSSNVVAAFCTSFIHGDDIICRTTEESISRLVRRIEKNMNGGFIGKKLGWVSDTMSLTVSSLQSHAHGSEGEETRLTIPGRAFLIRPRRLGGSCSIHEVGNLKRGGREALREALLWQMNDILLSTSMWKHHDLEAYIQGLDRTQLRGAADDQN